MEFKKLVEDSLKESLKKRDAVRASVMRMLLAAIKNKEVEKRGLLTEEEFFLLVKKSVSQHDESIESFQKGNRMDLVERETEEREILKSFLPAQLSDEVLTEEIESAILEVKAVGKKDMGKVIKLLMEKFPGRVDGKTLSGKVVARLSST